MFDFHIITNIITVIIAWFGGDFMARKKIKNNFLTELQSNIDMLIEKNTQLYKEILLLREENAQLITNQAALKIELKKLQDENIRLSNKIDQLKKTLKNKQ